MHQIRNKLMPASFHNINQFTQILYYIFLNKSSLRYSLTLYHPPSSESLAVWKNSRNQQIDRHKFKKKKGFGNIGNYVYFLMHLLKSSNFDITHRHLNFLACGEISFCLPQRGKGEALCTLVFKHYIVLKILNINDLYLYFSNLQQRAKQAAETNKIG